MSTHSPAFLQTMQRMFASTRSNQFLLVGNVHDLVDAASCEDAERPYLPLGDFLRLRLHVRGHLVIRLDIGHGLRIDDGSTQALMKLAGKQDPELAKKLVSLLAGTRQDPSQALLLAQRLMRLKSKKPISLILEQIDLLIPASDESQATDQLRQRLALLREWMCSPATLDHHGAIIGIARSVADVHSRLRDVPHLELIEVPLPDEDDRLAFLKHWSPDLPAEKTQDLASYCAGLSLLDIRSLAVEADWKQRSISRQDILQRVNELLALRIGDHLRLIHVEHNMEDVRGHSALKAELARTQKILELDDASLAPSGILCSGPNGCGKTFTFGAWAKDCGRVAVELHNLRGSYFGETDRIFAQVRQVLEQLGHCLILIDEADTQLSAPASDQHETENRLSGNILRLMGDPRHRGRLLWVLLTARPERLAPDFKRNGRAGLHLPVFPPQGQDKQECIQYYLQSAGLEAHDEQLRLALLEASEHWTLADFHEFSVQLRCERALYPKDHAHELLQRVLQQQHKQEDSEQFEEQILQAKQHCNRPNLVPSHYH